MQDYRLCDTQISVPETVEISPRFERIDYAPDGSIKVVGLAFVLRTHDEASHIALDAATGVERTRDVKSDDAADFAEITTRRVSTEPAAWPYTDGTGAATSRAGDLEYRYPDPTSGFAVMIQSHPASIIVSNCRSTLVIYSDPELSVDWRSVDPLDRPALETFVAQVSVSAGH